MKIEFLAAVPADPAILAIAVEKDADQRQREWPGIDAAGQAIVAGATQAARFTGEAGAIVEMFLTADGGVRHVLLVGVGDGSEPDWEKAGGALTAKLLTSGATALVVDLSMTAAAPTPKAAARFAGAAAQRGWRYDDFRTTLAANAKPTLTRIAIVGAPDGTAEAWTAQEALTVGLDLTRRLVAAPPNILYPESFVAWVREDVAGSGLDIDVLDEAAMAALGMGALLGVSQGSRREAQLLVLRWNGAGADDPAVALVGKGVTFDTGGISIKGAANMEDMKWDMGGAGAVAGAMKALALRNAKANVIGVCGLVENMPDGNAMRPGDVVTTMSGQTVEVINTDAEGRLVLCDAITWVQRTHKVKTIVDLATLTGAMIVSLGSEYGGLFANDDDLAGQLVAAGLATGDKLWRFPLASSYDKLIDSQIADMKNVGPRGAGSITAAQFIKRFVEDGVKWAHLDIAGMVWSDKAGTTYDKGATGYGVRVLDRFVADNFES